MCKAKLYAKIPNNRIDFCMRKFIKNLNKMFDKEAGIEIIASCCGHKRYPMSIIIRSDDGQGIDIVSDTKIPRTRSFYKRDKQGYYFIPEITKEVLR